MAGAHASVRYPLGARNVMDACDADPLAVVDLAALAGASPAHSSREFRKVFGEAPHRYLSPVDSKVRRRATGR